MGNDLLEKKIDANTNKNLEQQEVLNFIKSEKNLQELGNYLSKTVGGWSDNLVRVSSNVITKSIVNIDKKVRGNQLLSVEEKALMKLKYAMEKKEYPLNDTVLNMYLGTNFGNFGYKPNTESIIVVKKTLEKKVESQSLPFLKYKKGYETASINNLLEWAKNNNPTGYETERKKSEIRNDNKDDQYKDDYIKYDLALYSFDLYSKLVTKKDREIQKKAGYSTEEDFTKQGELIASLSQALDTYKKEKFPTIDATFDKFKKYNDDINKTAKKAGYTTPEKQKESAAVYTIFQKDSMKLVEQYNIQDIVAKIKNPQLSSGTNIEEYFGNVNKMLEYTQEYEQLQQKTGLNTLKKYEGYLSQIDIITKKYGVDSIKEWGSDIEKYVAGVTALKNTYHGSTIDRKKYEDYQKLAQNSAIGRYTEGRYGLYQLLKDPANKNSPFRGLKQEAQIKEKDQNSTDTIWQTIKTINPAIYQVLNFGASAWNGVVDFTVGTGSSLGLMLMSTYKDDDERKASADFKQSFDGFLKFNLSRSQSKPPLDEQGNWNLGLDNTVSQVGGQLANMVALLSGSGAIGRGVTKLGVGAVISQRIGLVSMAFMQQAGRSFEEGKTQGLDDGQALSYSMLQSSIGAGLELISPNQMMMGTGKKVVKEYIKNIIKTETKQSILQVGKIFTKNIVGEVLEENIQETMQLAVGNGINMWANDMWGTKFDANWSMDNFATTALLTTLTTGLGTSKQALSVGVASTQVLSPLQKQDLKQKIISDPVLYGQTTKVLNDIVSRKVQLEGVDIGQMKELQSELKKMESGKKSLVVENKNDPDVVSSQSNVEDNIKNDGQAKESEKNVDIQNSQIEANNLDDKKSSIEKINRKQNINLLEKYNLWSTTSQGNLEDSNYIYNIGNILSLVPTEKLEECIKSFSIDSIEKLSSMRYVIMDPVNSIDQKQKLVQDIGGIISDNFNDIYVCKIYEKLGAKLDTENIDDISHKRFLYANNGSIDISHLSLLEIKQIFCIYGGNFYSTKGLQLHVQESFPITSDLLSNIEDDILGNRIGTADAPGRYLRDGINPKKMPLYEQLVHYGSNKILDKLPTYQGIVYRGVRLSLDELSKSLGQIKEGLIIQDSTIPNFSPHKEDGKSFSNGKTLFVIKSNNGRLYYEGASEPHVLYKANTPMRVAKIESNKDGMQNIVYLEEVDNISLTNNDGSFSPETAKFNDYFGKEARFGFDSKQARDHSTFMDQFSGQATVEQITQIRQKIEAVAQMYADKTGKKLELTDTQIQAIIDTHLLPGQLGQFTQAELLTKNKKLAEAIPDGDLRRFLLEAGFCGKINNKSQEPLNISEHTTDDNFIYKRIDSLSQTKTREDIKKNPITVLGISGKEYIELFNNKQSLNRLFIEKTGMSALERELNNAYPGFSEAYKDFPFNDDILEDFVIKDLVKLSFETNTNPITVLDLYKKINSQKFVKKYIALTKEYSMTQNLQGTLIEIMKDDGYYIDQMDNNNIIDLCNHLSKLEKLFSKKEILSMYQKGLIYEDIISIKNAFSDLSVFYYEIIRSIGIENAIILKKNLIDSGFDFSDRIFFDIDKIMKTKSITSIDDLLHQIEGYNFWAINKVLKEYPDMDLTYVSRITNDSQFYADTLFTYKEQLEKDGVDIYLFQNYKDLFNYIVNQYIRPELKPELSNLSLSDIKTYHNKIKNYIGYSLLESDYQDLFMQEGGKGKYGKSHIEQGNIGDCYLIAELIGIKDKHFFEYLIRTSLTTTDNGYEIILPLGSGKNGKTITVTKEEIQNPHIFEGELAQRANTKNRSENNNFDMTHKLGFTILEIAYNKLIANDNIDIKKLTGGLSLSAGKNLISKKLISQSGKYEIRKLNKTDIQGIVNILSNFKSGNSIVSISRGFGGDNLTKNTTQGKEEVLQSQHAYIVTGTKYINNELIIEVTNPHSSQQKVYEFNLNELLYTFDDVEYINVNINAINNDGSFSSETSKFKD